MAPTNQIVSVLSPVDAVSGSLKTLDFEIHQIHEGRHFYISGFETKDVGEVIEIVATQPDTARWSHLATEAVSTKGFSMLIYEGVTNVVGGTPITAINNNRNSDIESGVTILKDPTSYTIGTMIDARAAGSNKSAGFLDRSDELIMKQGETYVFQLTSLDNANLISYRGSWYEHISKVV